MKEASFYNKIDFDQKTVQCTLCAHQCKITNNSLGRCHVRQNIDGQLVSHVYGKLVSASSDPIEKKPLFHFLPGSKSYSVATVGCNFTCKHCQNYEISQYPKRHKEHTPGTLTTPAEVIAAAQHFSCKSISYTYVEPTIFFEFAYDTAQLGSSVGIKNVFVSNGYTSAEAIREIAPYLDANNIDLKSFSDSFYKKICGARLAPVLDTIQLLKELGVWLEVTTLIIPGLNDTDAELKNIARFISGLDAEIPWHVSRFHPTYKLTDLPSTSAKQIFRAQQIGFDAGLKHVYTGNIPGHGGEDTLCPSCHKVVIKRQGFTVLNKHISKGKCNFCETPIAGIF